MNTLERIGARGVIPGCRRAADSLVGVLVRRGATCADRRGARIDTLREQLVKIHFADSGTRADVLANLEAARVWVLNQNEENLATARAYLEGTSAFPERAALNQLTGMFLAEYYVMIARWVQWATETVSSWPDDVKNAPFDTAAAEEGVRLAASIPRLLAAPAARSDETA